jgi:hypothetical protein
MADQKLTQLNSISSVSSTDLLYAVSGITPTSYKATAQQIATFVASITQYGNFDAIVDGVGGKPNTYDKLSNVPSGKKCINVIASYTETANVIPSNDCLVYLNQGVTVSMGANYFDLSSLVNFVIKGYDKSSVIRSSFSSFSNILFVTPNTTINVLINNLTFDYTSATASPNTQFNETYTSNNFILSNINFLLGHQTLKIYVSNYLSYAEYINFIGNNAACSSTIFGNLCFISNITYSGTFNTSVNYLDLTTSYASNINVNLNSQPSPESSQSLIFVLRLQSQLSIVSSFYTYSYSISCQRAGFLISNCPQIDVLTTNNFNGKIIGCTAYSYGGIGTGTVQRVGNNSVIGNDYLTSETIIPYYDANVDGFGINPNTYVTVGAAVLAGKSSIKVTAHVIETGNIVFSNDTYIFINTSASIGMGSYSFDLNAINNLIINGFSPTSSSIIYTGSENNLFINTSGSNLSIYFQNLTFDFSEASQGVNGAEDSSNLSMKNFIILANINTNIYFNTNVSVANGITVYGNGGSSSSTIFLQNGARGYNFIYNGSFSTVFTQVLYIVDSSLFGVYFNLDSAPPLGEEPQITLYGGTLQNVNAIDNGYYNITNYISGSSNSENLIQNINNCSDLQADNIGFLSISNALTNFLTLGGTDGLITITGSVAESFTNDFTGTLIRSGNNFTIGNDYDGTIPTFVSSSSVSMLYNIYYITQNSSLTTLTLPVAFPQGSIFKILGNGTGGWKIAQNSGQSIHAVGLSTTTGVSGYISSSNIGQSVELVATVANTTLRVVNCFGTLNIN